VGGLGSGRTYHSGAASKCEQWRSIDLVDLKRMGLLKPIVGNRIRAITWKNDHGWFDKLGIIPSARGIQFVKRDDGGNLSGLFVAYTYTPTMFGGYRQWFVCSGCRRPARILYGVNSLRCRRCRGLKYVSQSEAVHWRAQRKALSIRRRVGASGDGSMGRSRQSLQRCAGQLTNACELSMQLYRSNGSLARLEPWGGSASGVDYDHASAAVASGPGAIGLGGRLRHPA